MDTYPPWSPCRATRKRILTPSCVGQAPPPLTHPKPPTSGQTSGQVHGMTRERKSLIAGVGVLIFTVILAGVAVTAHTTNEPGPEWLMVMNAETGECQKVGDTYTLTLDGVDAQMLALTDRPEREAQMWDTSEFLDYWANEFDGDPPNAVISADGVRVALMLSDPRVGMSTRDDGAVTPTAGAVTFTATPLLGHEERDITFDQPTLFIDDLRNLPIIAVPPQGL